jgi:hypothetical protein
MRGCEYPHTSASRMPTCLPSVASAAARFAVTLDLPTPPLPDPMQTTFETWASDPSGSPPRPSLRPSAVRSCSESTSNEMFTPVTPSS